MGEDAGSYGKRKSATNQMRGTFSSGGSRSRLFPESVGGERERPSHQRKRRQPCQAQKGIAVNGVY